MKAKTAWPLAALLLLTASCSRAPKVGTYTLQPHDTEFYGLYAGYIRSQDFVEVRARVEGYLDGILCPDGSMVKKNQLLFVIDPKIYETKVAKAKAQLNKNKALEQKARRDLERMQALFDQNALSQLDMDNAIANAESAKAEVEMSEADLRQAEIALSQTSLRASVPGLLSIENVEEGTLVGPNGKSLLATLSKNDTMWVDFRMPSVEFSKSSSQGDSSVYLISSLDMIYPYPGYIDFANPGFDPVSHAYRMRAKVPNPGHILVPGQTPLVKVSLQKSRETLLVPEKAVFTENSQTYVMTLEEGNLCRRRAVSISLHPAGFFVVDEGLRAGEVVILADEDTRLREGEKVRVSGRSYPDFKPWSGNSEVVLDRSHAE